MDRPGASRAKARPCAQRDPTPFQMAPQPITLASRRRLGNTLPEFSILECALTGFRVVREHPIALLAWTAVAFVLINAIDATTARYVAPVLAALPTTPAEMNVDPAKLVTTLKAGFVAYLMLLAIGMVSTAVVGASMLRAVFRPEEGRRGFVRLGGDELRQLGLAILSYAVVLVAFLASALVSILALAPVAAADRQAAVALAPIFMAMMVGVCAYVSVRLSLAPARTFTTGKISLAASWRLTRGRVAPITAVYIVAFVLGLAVNLIGSAFVYAVVLIATGQDTTQTSSQPAILTLTTWFTPARLLSSLLSAVIAALSWPVFMTPPATLFQRLCRIAPGH